ncbi:GNAT family N-acetyltransferase [Paraburkholderia sp. MMS20-SJTN17]|uniref:GNAT family N-acetyltransferase n=1 Tax=Paraburkholderia translucens TaxID=2886945 RepID=A0ABS8K955_9BURK|nr:GNAT family N-acetyltransferase [Paraburkholderia sp. MMS20-SJTN17]MCC8401286.1 GNAT family N-acetyltransferase [Paraburkholderia sp. MMS20-SJTN17]
MKVFADESVSNGLQASMVESAAPPVRLPGEPTAQSIFREPWWLDIATGGHWSMVKVQRGKELLGQLPYYSTRKGGWVISRLPPLTRTLGPVIKPMGLDPAREQRHRQVITSELIEQLPHFDCFYQLFDPRVEDALAFSLHGFTVCARYTFRISPERTADEVWARLHTKTRNVIRTAGKKLTVAPVATPTEFMNFYDANLFERARTNAYGSDVMRELISAFVDRKAGQLLGAYGPGGQLVAAIGLVWDQNAMYYLLSSRKPEAHSGAISLLLWTAIQRALERKLTFDFDGFSCVGTYKFLEGFGGTLTQRLSVERMSTMYSIVRTLKRRIVPGSGTVFSHTL